VCQGTILKVTGGDVVTNADHRAAWISAEMQNIKRLYIIPKERHEIVRCEVTGL
jgi:hypothetical protein